MCLCPRRLLADGGVFACLLAVGPIPARPLAAAGMPGRHARLCWVVPFFERVDVSRIEAQCFKYGTRRRPVVQRALRHAQAMGRLRETIERMQPGMRQMDMGGEVVALAPRFGGAFDVAENGGRDGPAISGRQECEHLPFPACQAFQPAQALSRNQDGARAQHQTPRRKDHRPAGERRARARKRAVARLFVQHVSSPSFVAR